MSLFTFVLEYNGGTNTKQAEGETLADAVQSWAESMEGQSVGKGAERLEGVVDAIKTDQPVPLKGCHNAFCSYFKIGRWPALLNVIKTDRDD